MPFPALLQLLFLLIVQVCCDILFVTMLLKLLYCAINFQFLVWFKCYIQLIIVCVHFFKFIFIYFFLYYRGPSVRKLFTGLIMYYALKIKNIVLYCIVLYCKWSYMLIWVPTSTFFKLDPPLLETYIRDT